MFDSHWRMSPTAWNLLDELDRVYGNCLFVCLFVAPSVIRLLGALHVWSV
jgi:hypothetical protein